VQVYSDPLIEGSGVVGAACSAKPRCANFLWLNKGYVDSDAYGPTSPPLPDIALFGR
jgi:hypothetical protein